VRPGTGTDVGVGTWIERRARVAPDRPALVFGARTSTYGELAVRIRRLANGLRGLGVGRGDRVAWIGPNHPAFLESLFAAGLLGAVIAPVNDRLSPDERALVLRDTEPCALLHHAAAGAVDGPETVRHRIVVGGPVAGAIDYESLVATSPDAVIDEQVGLADLLFLPHTSGTTGGPKGVMLSHGNVTWNAVNLLTSVDYRAADVTIAIAPFFRVGGTGVNVLPVLFVGGTVVIPDDPTPDSILGLMEHHRVTVGFGNPDLLEALTRSPLWPTADLSSIRFVITGGAPVPERLIHAYLDRGIALQQGYGLSEAAPFVLLLDASHSLAKVGSAGTPPLFVDVRIAVADGREASAGETGELLVRGPNVMAGYWRRPADTDRVLTADGWLRTGDAARMDPEGFVWIVGRVADGFEIDGELVHPGDVERVFLTHPSVAEVGVAAAPGAAGAAIVVAFIVPTAVGQASEEELLAFGRAHLPARSAPTAVRLVEALPRNTVGKLIRGELQSLAITRIS
jgi:fatty-acyl-CoA synthase